MPWHEGLRAGRFWAKVEKTESCWNWKGDVASNGYGRVCVHYRYISVHRYVFTLLGTPVPADKVVCHACDNRLCVNPAHLFIGTQLDNVRDMLAKGRGARPRVRETCRHGHAMTPENTAVYRLRRDGRVRTYTRCRTCAVSSTKRWRAAHVAFSELPGAES